MPHFSINIDDLHGARKSKTKARGRKQKTLEERRKVEAEICNQRAVDILLKFVKLGILDLRDLQRVCVRCETVVDIAATGSLFCPKCKTQLSAVTGEQAKRHLQRQPEDSKFAKILDGK